MPMLSKFSMVWKLFTFLPDYLPFIGYIRELNLFLKPSQFFPVTLSLLQIHGHSLDTLYHIRYPESHHNGPQFFKSLFHRSFLVFYSVWCNKLPFTWPRFPSAQKPILQPGIPSSTRQSYATPLTKYNLV